MLGSYKGRITRYDGRYRSAHFEKKSGAPLDQLLYCTVQLSKFLTRPGALGRYVGRTMREIGHIFWRFLAALLHASLVVQLPIWAIFIAPLSIVCVG